MTKQEFLMELSKALAPIDPETRAEIMADMNDHFAEGASLGLSEEEICKNLGQPGQIAEQVIEELGTSKGQNSQSQSNWQAGSQFADAINNLVGDIGNLVGNIGNMKGQYESSDDFRVVGIDLSNIGGDAQFSGFNAGDTTRVKGGYEINIDETFTNINSLNIALSLCALNIMPAPQGEPARVVIQGRSRYNNFLVENKNGCLTIIERNPLFRFEVFGFKNTLKAIVYLPVGFDGDIKVKTSAGNISIFGLCGNLDLNASAGSISVENHKCSMALLRSSAGGLKIKGSEIDNISAKSSAGAIYIDGDTVNNLKLDSSAGGISVRAAKLVGDTEITSSAGATRLEASYVEGNITAKASAGSIKMRLPKDVNCRIELKKPNIGSVNNYLTGNPNSPYVIQASASVGSVTLEALDLR